jgi:hypothetical protein
MFDNSIIMNNVSSGSITKMYRNFTTDAERRYTT